MNRFERLQAAVAGTPLDRVPVSAWGHFFNEETTAEGLADVMVRFQQTFDWDYLKIHARASYHAEGFGFRYEASTRPGQPHKTLGHPIARPEDWRKLRPLGLDHPALAEQFRAIELIRDAMAGEVPLIMTVFSPLDVAGKLVDQDKQMLIDHLRQDPDSVAQALAVFAETFAPFVRRLGEVGIDGLYFSSKWANRHKLPAEEYRRLARPHDLQVLAEAQGLGCNIMHLCEDAIHLEAMADYPVHVFHWDNCADNNPSLADGRATVGKTVGGGVDSPTLATAPPEEVERKARRAIEETGGRGLILGPGCSILTAKTSEANLRALRRAVEPA
jgi:uroporphyrinogen decarboxylase